MFLFCTLEWGPALSSWLSGKSPHPRQENEDTAERKHLEENSLSSTAAVFGRSRVCRAIKTFDNPEGGGEIEGHLLSLMNQRRKNSETKIIYSGCLPNQIPGFNYFYIHCSHV